MAAAEDRLVPVALALLDGASVDWAEVMNTLADPEERELLQDLRALEPILRSGDDESRSWGDLRILEKIGSGAFGEIYRAWDDRLGREVALKILSTPPDAVASESLLDEARRLAQVKHPAVVTIYGAGRSDGRAGFWMELLQGQSLSAVMNAQGRLGAAEAALVGVDLCRALAAVHGAGLLHRDLKADNVIREEGGRTVLTDFGSGTRQANTDEGLSGTPLFMAPEVLNGAPASIDADLYSLGVLLYHLVTGSYPVQAATVAELRAAHERGERTRLRDARPDLPGAFVSVVEKALAPSATRFRSAGAMEAALVGTLDVPPVARSRAAALGLTIAAAALALAGLATLARRPPVAAPPESRPLPAAPENVPAAVQLWRTTSGAPDRALADGDPVVPGDHLALSVQPRFDVFLYVIDEDEGGNAFLLFPLPGDALQNPLHHGQPYRLPGPQRGQPLDWQVTSAGGREHILVFIARERQAAFEQIVAHLPAARLGHPVTSLPLPPDAVVHLRGIGGLVAAKNARPSHEVQDLAQPLTDDRARGPWLREIVLSNPR